MAELKTQPTKESVSDFINSLPDEQRRKDCRAVVKMMKEATGAKPEMWGSGIVGFGRMKYTYANGKENEWMMVGFSPRKNDLTFYIMSGADAFPDLMSRLGKHKTGRSCVYVKKLDDIDFGVLKKIVERSVSELSVSGFQSEHGNSNRKKSNAR